MLLNSGGTFLIRPLVLISGLAFACASLWALFPYRLILQDLYNDLRYGPSVEFFEKAEFLAYFGNTIGKLQRGSDGDLKFPSADSSSQLDLSLYDWGKIAFHKGNYEKAVSVFREIIEADQQKREDVLFWLAIASFRRAEALSQLSASSQSGFSYEPGFPYVMDAKYRRLFSPARDLFRELVEMTSGENKLYHWMYFLSSFYVEGEAATQLLSDSLFKNLFFGQRRQQQSLEYSGLKMVDQSSDFGFAAKDSGKGLAVEDFDGDGFLDLVVASSFGELKFFLNVEGRSFSDRTKEARLGGLTQAYTISAADFDNDGLVDLFVTRPYHSYRLMKNLGGAVFQDVTEDVGLIDDNNRSLAHCTWHSAWSDIDNDGDLDLFLSQWGQQMPFSGDFFSRAPESSRLLVFDGGRYYDRTEEFGLSHYVDGRNYVAASFGDYDGDGFADLFLSSFNRRLSVLLRNNQGKKFSNPGTLISSSPGFTVSFLDVDHDGKLEIFHAGNAPASTTIRNAVYESNFQQNANRIYARTQSGDFYSLSDYFGDNLPATTLGATFGDLNNDGCHDFYFGTGNPEDWFIFPDLAFVGRSRGRSCSPNSANISMLEDLHSIQKGQGVVMADIDNDGDQDIISIVSGLWPGATWRNRVLINETNNGNQWVKIRLRGRKSNRMGIGAMISVEASAPSGEKIVRSYHMSNKTGFGSAPYLAHVGLMDALPNLRVTVRWPGTGESKLYRLKTGQMYVLDESEGELIKSNGALDNA